MSRLILFYRGLAPDSEGRSLAEIQAYSDDEMESVHDFIQWMFPLPEPSRYNPDAPLLTDLDVDTFRDDPSLRDSLHRSLVRFLAFLGLAIEGARVVEGPDFAVKADVWRSSNHNWLRITRVLACTRRLGLEAESLAFFHFLDRLRGSSGARIDASTFAYWDAAARGA